MNRIKKIQKLITIMAFTICVLLMQNGTSKAVAASKKDKALKAYKKYISGKTIKWNKQTSVNAGKCSFSVVYIDNDSIPELLLTRAGNNKENLRLFTYKNGKVTNVEGMSKDEFTYYEKKSVYAKLSTEGQNGEKQIFRYMQLKNGKASCALLACYDPLGTGNNYYNGEREKEISVNKFSKELERLTGTDDIGGKSPKFRKNTKVNRKKYLK